MLRTAVSSRNPAAVAARPRPVPAPVGGLNALDSISDMPESDALVLDNVFPQPDYVELRRGYESHVTGVAAAMPALMEWAGLTSRKLFAAKATDIYEVTSAGAVGAAVVSSLTNGEWQHTMQETSGGNFLVICNGADSVRNYDGTSWTTPSITGVTSADLINVASHKERLWFVEKDTCNAWYLGTEAIAGAATKFPLGSVFKNGGTLKAIGTVTRDGGNGPDDLAAFVSSTGEVAIYQGTDPASASTWALVGVFETSPPLGYRCVQKSGGDLAILTESGVLSLNSMLVLDRAAAQRAAVTSKINRLFTEDARAYRGNHGWQMLSYPRSNMFIVNVPVSATTRRQYVMNALTGAWCRFTGMNAGAWSLLDEDLYFSDTAGTVFKADSGYTDNAGGITGDIKTAFNDLGAAGVTKTAQMARAMFASNGTPGFLVDINVDFGDQVPTSSPTPGTAPTSTWGSATWGGSTWTGGDKPQQQWFGVTGEGHEFAVRCRVVSVGATCRINGFDLLTTRGGLV